MSEQTLNQLRRIANDPGTPLRHRKTLLTAVTEFKHALDDINDIEFSSKLRHDSDMRAIKRWREANPGNDHKWPDLTDLSIWLMDRLVEAETALSPVLPDEVVEAVPRIRCERSLSNAPNLNGLSKCNCQKCRDADLIERLVLQISITDARMADLMDEKAADEQRIEELTEENKENGTALNNALLTIKGAQQRIVELENARDGIHKMGDGLK